ncbi:MAG: ATP-binding protein [Thermoproteota archaeon]|nr:ATP-binding protein [Thermoproteota archaeon]
MSRFKSLIEVGAKILDKLDEHLLPAPGYINSNSSCTPCEQDNENEQIHYRAIKHIKSFTINNKDSIFDGIIGYSDIKKEFAKALEASSPVGILLVEPPGCGKSEFLKHIRAAYDSVVIDGSYGSKAGIFEKLYEKRPRYVLLDEIDKLSCQDQQALFNLMEGGRLTKTTKSESYDIQFDALVFATANNKEDIVEPLFDRFERYFLSEYTDEEFRTIAIKRLKQEGIENGELALYIANAVLRGLNRKSLRDVIRIARKSMTIQDVDETVQTLMKYVLK